MISENKIRKYLMYAIGEIILVVIGILIALQINIWNENRKESESENQLIDVLITDLKSKKAELLGDLTYCKEVIQKSDLAIQHWENNAEIDTTNLKFLLTKIGEDNWFFSENSPIYGTISDSGLWKDLPDSLTSQINNMYRNRFGGIKLDFEKQREYAHYVKLNFLAPNHLLTLDKETSKIQKIVFQKGEEYISCLELSKSGTVRLASNFERTVPPIDKLIDNLERYKQEK